MKDIILIGASGHARVIIDIIERNQEYQICGIIDENNNFQDLNLYGYPQFNTLDSLHQFNIANNSLYITIAVGDNFARASLAFRIQELFPSIRFASLIHPSASISSRANIGQGTVVMPGAILNSNTYVGQHCIINTNATLDHDSTMGDFASLAPGVTCGGGVHIGEYSAIGIGATIKHCINISNHVVIGAGSVVLSHIPNHTLAYGVPAQIIKSRNPGDKYL